MCGFMVKETNMTVNINEELGTTEIKWNLTDLYSNYDDPQIEKEIVFCENEATTINAEYAEKVYKLDAEELHGLVAKLESLETRLGRLFTFAFLNFATCTHDQQVSAFLQRMREIASDIGKDTVFFIFFDHACQDYDLILMCHLHKTLTDGSRN